MVWRRLTRLQQQGLKVQDLINQDLGGWNSNLIKEIFEEPIAMKILQTPVGITGEKDNLIWPHSTSGDFSIKTGYHAARAEAQLESTTPPILLIEFRRKSGRLFGKTESPRRLNSFSGKHATMLFQLWEIFSEEELLETGCAPFARARRKQWSTLFFYAPRQELFGLGQLCSGLLILMGSCLLIDGFMKGLHYYRGSRMIGRQIWLHYLALSGKFGRRGAEWSTSQLIHAQIQ